MHDNDIKFMIFALNSDLPPHKELAAVQATFLHKCGMRMNDIDLCEGVYKGEVEQSYLIPMDKGTTEYHVTGLIYDLAKQYKQESVLVVDTDNNAELWYVDCIEATPIGTWTEVTAGKAQLTDYTYNKTTNQYFITQ